MQNSQPSVISTNIITNGRITDQFFRRTSEGYQLLDEESQLTPLELNKRSLLLMFQNKWDKVFKAAKLCSVTKGVRISNEVLEGYYREVSQEIPKYCYQGYSLVHAYKLLNKFIGYQNTHFQIQSNAYLMPPKAVKAKINTLSVDFDWVKNGKHISSILKAVYLHWQSTDDYTEIQIIGWLIFSAMIYGGINDKKTLISYLNTIRDTDKRQSFINFNVIGNVHYENKSYGNEYIGDDLYCTQQIVIDTMTMCWLIRLNNWQKKTEISRLVGQKISKNLTENEVESILKATLSPVLVPHSIKIPTLSFMLSNSSYIWEMLPDVHVDQALLSVLKGQQGTVGITEMSFKRLLNQKYQPIEKSYKNNEFLDLKISASDKTDDKTSSRRQADDELDFIKGLKKRLHKNYQHQNKSKSNSTLVDDLMHISNSHLSLNYKVLARWVLSLVEREGINNESISKYITAMGYEWLAFTKNQPIENWAAENFEELYDEILDDMAVRDLSYPAKQLQNMHRFAEVEYGFPKVRVPLTSSRRKVRSEWFSPQLFSALIEQLRIGIDPIEADMLTVFFIIAYRTGMRKKEILGLKYSDIEGMKQGKPSILIRPNHYRSIKTDNSIREVPIFALLKPFELELFIKFITINETNNKQRFIFTMSSSQRPLADHAPLKLLNLLYEDIDDSNSVRMTFHGFRHTAMSNLALVIQGHDDLVMSLTDYDEEDIERIKKGLLGETTWGQELWYSCAHLLGHLAPDRGFEYYNHTAWLMASYSISQANIQLPYTIFNNITAIDKKKLKENGYSCDRGNVSLQKIRKLLYRKVLNKDYRKPKRFTIQEDCSNPLENTVQNHSEKMLLQRYGLKRVIGFLEDMVEAKNVDNVAAKFDIDALHAEQYYINAQQVHKIVTTRGHKRFFAKNDSIKLAPSLLTNSREQRILSQFFENATDIKEKKDEQWYQFILMAASKLSTSRSSINFPTKNMDEVIYFLKIGIEMIEEKYWLVRIDEKMVSLIKERLLDYPDLKFEPYKPKKEVDKDGNTIYKTMDIISLGIHKPNSKRNASTSKNIEKTEISNYEYSPLLRFVIHLTLILDLDGQFFDSVSESPEH